MSNCKKYGITPSVAYCLACEHCLPPSERINGRMCPDEVLDTDGMMPTEEERQQIIDILRRGMQNRIVAMINPELARELAITPAEVELLKKYAVEIQDVEILPPDFSELKNISMDGPATNITIQFKIKPQNPKEL